MKSLKEGIKERGCPNRPSQDFCNIPFKNFGGVDGTRTRDPRRDRPVF